MIQSHIMTERQKQILAELEAYLMPGYVEPYTTPDHDATHPQRMCLIANKIAGDEINLFLLQTTIWFHNLDRSTYPFTEGDRTSHEYIPRVIRGFTSRYPDIFSHKDQDVIVDTVEKHDRLNAPDDSPVTVYLKDCDRLDGMGAIGLVRTVDYARKRKLPLYTPSDFDNIPD
ncbi:MAG: hypothetical protein HYS57_02900, partial [Parcubacteria group bacterium]|nr:hypothetical protein [Parcubacteria group bacterium]